MWWWNKKDPMGHQTYCQPTLHYRIKHTCVLFDGFPNVFYSIHVFSYLIENFHPWLLFHPCFFLFNWKFPPMAFIPSMFFLIWLKIFTHGFYLIPLFDWKFPPMSFIPSMFFLIWLKISTHGFYSIHVFSYLIENFHPWFLFHPCFSLFNGEKIKMSFILSMCLIR